MPRHLNEKVRRATCGNWRIEQGECRRRERRKRDVEANIPRPLYRHCKGGGVSFGSGDGMLSPDLPRDGDRHLIWEYAVEESRSTVPRLSCVECVHRPSPNGWENLMPCIPSCPDCGVAWDTLAGFMGKVRWGGCGIERPNIEWRPLALGSAANARASYSEAIDILYNTSTFRFPQTQSLIQRMAGDEQPKPIEDFIATVLPQRLERITRVSTGVCFPWFEALNDVVTRNLPSLRYLELRARLLGTRGNDTGSNTDALSQLVIGVQSRRVPPRLGSQLPQELEVVITPDKAWERSGKWFPMV
ncbi:hypothetical protein F4808DRAFT_445274 [Astrocystis sublimbata]|nr:hypothetical protein F4808DRAFT_445274 [Astrocystis sublimbata]